MHQVKRYFLAQPMERSFNMLNMIAQIVITYHNDRAGRPLIDDTCNSKGVNPSNKIMVFLPGLVQIHQFCEIFRGILILVGQRCLYRCHSMVKALQNALRQICGTICASSDRKVPVRAESRHL